MTTTLDTWEKVVLVAGAPPPALVLLEEIIYPYAYVYDGPCEVSTFTFTTIPFTPASWISGKLAATVESEVRKAGGRVMEMRVYVDENLLRPWTNWRFEVVGTVPSIAASIGITWWAAAILAALAILLIIAITWAITTIVSTFNHKPNIEEVKPTWSRESLISVIGDFETKLNKIPTPPEDLEQMSDNELRIYVDEMAGQIAPGKGIPWGWVALGAGALGVLLLTSKVKPGKAKKA